MFGGHAVDLGGVGVGVDVIDAVGPFAAARVTRAGRADRVASPAVAWPIRFPAKAAGRSFPSFAPRLGWLARLPVVLCARTSAERPRDLRASDAEVRVTQLECVRVALSEFGCELISRTSGTQQYALVRYSRFGGRQYEVFQVCVEIKVCCLG